MQDVQVPTTEELEQAEFWLASAVSELDGIRMALERLEDAYSAPSTAYLEVVANKGTTEAATVAAETTPAPESLTDEEIGRLFLFLAWAEKSGEHIAEIARSVLDRLEPVHAFGREVNRDTRAAMPGYYRRVGAMLRGEAEHYAGLAKGVTDA